MQRLLTLGSFTIAAGDAPSAAVVQPKRLALLAYLALATPRGLHRRDTLLALFWPELADEEARRALRQALHHLRRGLGDDALVARRDDQLGLGPGIACDAIEFEDALDAGRPDEALALYRGDFLDGVHVPDASQELEEWVARTRARLRGRAVDAARRGLALASDEGRPADALAAAFRAHELVPDDEEILRRLLALLHAVGDRAGAARVYDAFARRVREAYGVEPAPATVALAAELRRAPPAMLATAPAPRSSPPVEPRVEGASVGPPPAVPPSRPRRRLLWIGAAALAAVVVAAGVRRLQSSASSAATLIGSGVLRSRDRILIAEMRDRAGDSSLALALGEALRVDLAQSPVFELVSDAEVRRTLGRMGQSVATAVRDSVAREVAERDGSKAIVTGDVSRVGGAYVLSAQLVAARTGALLGAARETARDSTELIASIDRLSAALRRRVGETLRSIASDPPLSQVTTASLPALRRYSEASALADGDHPDRQVVLRMYEETIALDSTFASAWWALGTLYQTLGEPARALAALHRAFALRDRLPVEERDFILGSYYRNVTQEYDKAAAAYLHLLERNPDDVPVLVNLGLVYRDSRQFERADSLFRRAIAVDSSIPMPYISAALASGHLGRFPRAHETLAISARRFPEYPIRTLAEIELAADEQDWPTMLERATALLAQPGASRRQQLDANEILGQASLILGHLSDAESHLRAATDLAEAEQSPGRSLADAILLAWLDLRYRGRTAAALAGLDAELGRHPMAAVAVLDRPYVPLAELYIAAGRPRSAVALAAALDRDSAAQTVLPTTTRVWVAGLAALAVGNAARAIDDFRRVDATDRCTMCVLPDLAQAYEAFGDLEGATASLERYQRTPWGHRNEADAAGLGWRMIHLGELYERSGQVADAGRQYARVLALWSDADPELAPVRADLRSRLARVRFTGEPADSVSDASPGAGPR